MLNSIYAGTVSNKFFSCSYSYSYFPCSFKMSRSHECPDLQGLHFYCLQMQYFRGGAGLIYIFIVQDRVCYIIHHRPVWRTGVLQMHHHSGEIQTVWLTA